MEASERRPEASLADSTPIRTPNGLDEGTPRKKGRSRPSNAPMLQQQANVGELDFDFGLQSDVDAVDTDVDSGSQAAPATGKLSTKKKEALSQVPCKFFRSNGCSAGSACPFAHVNPGETSSKAVCQWFLKGNCRFGHKCALAHILPGQPLSMDRKNKRAQQHQTQNSNPNAQYQQQYARQPLPVHHATMHNRDDRPRQDEQHTLYASDPRGELGYHQAELHMNGQDSRHMASMYPDSHHTNGWTARLMNDADVQQREAHPSAESYSNNVVQSGSVPSQIFGTSPFSHPGSQSVFYSDLRTEHARPMQIGDSSNGFSGSFRDRAGRSDRLAEIGDEDDNAEEFLPSSLSDLLTPVELERRRKSVLASQRGHAGSGQSAAAAVSTVSQSVPGLAFGSVPAGVAQGRHTGVEGPGIGGRARSSWSKQSTDGVNGTLWGGTPRFGASNSSTGFLSSRLREELRKDDGDRTVDEATQDGGMRPYSPDTHAALAHVPGQSLPQGLAVGLSRLQLRSATEDRAAAQTRTNVSLLSSSRLSGPLDADAQHAAAVVTANDYGVIGAAIRPGPLNEDLGPTAPSSIFAHRNTPLHQHFIGGKNGGQASVSTSIDTSASPGFQPGASTRGGGGGGGGLVGSYTASPALGAQADGIAIPGNPDDVGDPGSFAGSHRKLRPSDLTAFGTAATQQRHPGVHRVRTGGAQNAGMSPWSLPTTGEEVDEAIFELE